MATNPHFSPPTFADADGEFSVDYRSHNGVVVLGEGDWSFQTRWSNAGHRSIHFYNTGAGTVCVGVAPTASVIEQISPEVYSSCDFSSDTRTPEVGRVALIENEEGYAAAIEILEVKSLPDGEPGSLLRARYKILTDRTRDFKGAALAEIAASAQLALEALTLARAYENKDVPEPPGLGHNGPPIDSPLTTDEDADLSGRLRVLVANAEDRTLSWEAITEDVAVFGRLSRKIKSYLAERGKLIEEGAYQQLGAYAMNAVLGQWEVLANQLSNLGSIFGRMF